ncbi:MAG: diacylglycerol kinase family lipid kinase [Anaerolineae bacterium]|nr:diacylglycerol kinase family lipid kinase [Anaerolineae bacterium]
MNNGVAEPLKLFVVLNPVAGFTDPRFFRLRINRLCSKARCEYVIYETKEGESIGGVIEKALKSGYKIFVAAGGDGTISEVASCLVKKDALLGIIPCGTGNALARSLGIPIDIGAAFRILVGKHAVRQIDAMKVFSQYHVLNVGVGVTSAVVQKTTRPIKRRYGIIAYVLEAIRVLFGIQPHSFRLQIDGRRYRFRASEIFVACGGWLGISLPFSDLEILPDDGRLDVFVIKARNIWGYFQLAFTVLFGKPYKAPQMKYLPAYRDIVIETKRLNVPVQSDGDWIGGTPVTIEVCPNVINVIVPPKRNEPLIQRWRRLVQS